MIQFSLRLPFSTQQLYQKFAKLCLYVLLSRICILYCVFGFQVQRFIFITSFFRNVDLIHTLN